MALSHCQGPSNPHGKLGKIVGEILRELWRWQTSGCHNGINYLVCSLPTVICMMALWLRVTPPGLFKVKKSRTENLIVINLINTRGSHIDA